MKIVINGREAEIPSGKSAYEYAQEGGYTGTEAEFGPRLRDAVAFAPEEAEGGYIAGSTGEGSGPPQNIEIMIPVGIPMFTGSVVFKNGLIAGNKKIEGVADPEYSYDAANKGYVDSTIANISGPIAEKVTVLPGDLAASDPDAPIDPDNEPGKKQLGGNYSLSSKAVFVLPDPGSADVAKSCNVRCVSYGESYSYPIGSRSYLKFKADTAPTVNVVFNVLIVPVS